MEFTNVRILTLYAGSTTVHVHVQTGVSFPLAYVQGFINSGDEDAWYMINPTPKEEERLYREAWRRMDDDQKFRAWRNKIQQRFAEAFEVAWSGMNDDQKFRAWRNKEDQRQFAEAFDGGE